IAAVLFLPALLSKETAIVLPLVIAYCELFYFRDAAPLRKRLANAAVYAGGFVVPTAVYFLLRYIALGHRFTPPGARFTLALALATTPLVIVKYLGLMLIPVGYNLQHYTAPVGAWLSLSFLGPLLLILAVATAIWLARSRVLAFAGVWFILW